MVALGYGTSGQRCGPIRRHPNSGYRDNVEEKGEASRIAREARVKSFRHRLDGLVPFTSGSYRKRRAVSPDDRSDSVRGIQQSDSDARPTVRTESTRQKA